MTQLLHRLYCDRRGNVLMLTGLLFFVLVGAAGASIDLGRQQLVRIKLQQSSDAAALAGALAPTGADRQAVAARYFRMNFPAKYLGVDRPVPRVTLGNSVRVTAAATVPTTFIRFLGRDEVTADGTSNVQLAASQTQNYDLLLSIDVSGSMSYADVEGGRPVPAASMSAAHAKGVRLCQLTGLPYPCAGYGNGPSIPGGTVGYGLTGNTRLNAVREAAMTISRQMLDSTVENNESRVGLVTWAGEGELVQPLTTDSNRVYTAIDQMAAFGGTNSIEGMARARQALVASNPKHVRALVLLTDGKNTQRGQISLNRKTGAYNDGRSPPCNGVDMCRPANEETLPICEAAKNAGFLIYTVAFGSEISGSTPDALEVQRFLGTCASGVAGSNRNEYFFVAPNAATLQQVFAVILQQVQKVRIVE